MATDASAAIAARRIRDMRAGMMMQALQGAEAGTQHMGQTSLQHVSAAVDGRLPRRRRRRRLGRVLGLARGGASLTEQ